MRYAVLLCTIFFLAPPVWAEVPKPPDAKEEMEWGRVVDGLQCALTSEKKQVVEGAEPVFHLHLKFTREEGDRNVKFLNRYLDARRVTISFQNTATGEVFERSPEDGVHGPAPEMVKEDIAVMHKPLAPEKLLVGLVSPKGESIPPGTYSVAATYKNDATPDVKLYKGGDKLYDGPWRFWTGRILSPPITLSVKRVKGRPKRIKTNSALEVRVILNGVGWSWSEKKPKVVRVTTRPGYVVGKRYEIHVFVNGEDMEYGGNGLANSTLQEGKGIVPLPELISRLVANGETIKLRGEIEIFETSVAAKTPWEPKSGDYRALWKGLIEGKLDEEVQKTLISIGDAL